MEDKCRTMCHLRPETGESLAKNSNHHSNIICDVFVILIVNGLKQPSNVSFFKFEWEISVSQCGSYNL